jgi:hypothetical protein
MEIIEEDGLRMVHAEGVFVAIVATPGVGGEKACTGQASLCDPLNDPVVVRAIAAMRRRKQHELDVVALAFEPGILPLAAGAVQRLADMDVAVVRGTGNSAAYSAQVFVLDFIERRRAGVEQLRHAMRAYRKSPR